MLVRELFAKLGLNVDAASFAKGELAAAVVKGALEKVVDVAKEAAEGFVELIKSTAEAGKELAETAQSTGLTTTALQQLRDAAGELGIESDTLNVGLFQMARNLRDAAQGSEQQSRAFARLGVHAKDSHGKLRDTNAVLLDLAEGFAKLPDGAEKTALAMDLFGRSGARMIPLLNKGKQGMAELMGEQEAMTEEQIAAGKEFVETQYALHLVTRNLLRQAIAPLLPAITKLLKQYLAWQKANAGIIKQKIQKYIGLVITAVEKLAGAFSFLVRNAAMVKAIVITGLVYGFSQLEAAAVAAAAKSILAWTAAAAPFVAIAAVITSLLLIYDDLRGYMADVKSGSKVQHSLFGTFKKQIDEWLKPQKNDPWFVSALKSFVGLLRNAIRLMEDFDVLTGKWHPAVSRGRAAGPQTKDEADTEARELSEEKSRARGKFLRDIFGDTLVNAFSWVPGGDKNRAAYDTSLGPTDFTHVFGGGAPSTTITNPPSAAGRPMVVVNPAGPPQVNIYAAPGMSEERVGQIAADKIDEHWNAMMEEAGAAVGP